MTTMGKRKIVVRHGFLYKRIDLDGEMACVFYMLVICVECLVKFFHDTFFIHKNMIKAKDVYDCNFLNNSYKNQ